MNPTLHAAGASERLMRRQLLARYRWLCGRLADYQKEPVAAVEELRACLHLCLGRAPDNAEAAHLGEGPAEASAEAAGEGLAAHPEVPVVRIKLASCQHDAEVSAEATAAKLEALRVYSASAEGLGRLEVRHCTC